MAELVRVPEVAAGATQIVVSQWAVQPGSAFALGDPLVVIETDKAVVEVEAEQSATLLRPLVDAGVVADVGAPLALVGTPAEAAADLDALLAGLGVGTGSGNVAELPAVRRDVPAVPAELVGSDSGATTTPGAPAPAQASVTCTPQPALAAQHGSEQGRSREHGQGGPSSRHGQSGRVFASPIARRLLREAGESIEAVNGTGPGGRIRRRDVETFLAHRAIDRTLAPIDPTTAGAASQQPQQPGGAAAPLPGRGAGQGWVEIPHSRLRRAVATRLTASKREIPHFYLRRTAGLDALMSLRAQVNAAPDTKVSVNDLVLRAVAIAHRQVPEVNAIWTDDAMRQFEHVDIGVAIASPRGLVTPVLRQVETLSVGALSAQVKAFAAAAADGKLKQDDLEGGSIVVTNLGMFGVDEFSAIINPPHSAVLAVGAARREPVVGTPDDPDALVPATVMRLVLSVDHRVIDGALAATWMVALVDALEDPIRLLV